MKKRYYLYLSITLILAFFSLPFYNSISISQGWFGNYIELKFRTRHFAVFGENDEVADVLVNDINLLSSKNKLNIIAHVGNPEDVSIDTEIVVYRDWNKLISMSDVNKFCGQNCIPEDGEHLKVVSVGEIGLFRRNWKMTFINAEKLVVNNVISGERFQCLLELIIQEVIAVVSLKNPCDVFEDYKVGTSRHSFAKSIIGVSVSLPEWIARWR